MSDALPDWGLDGLSLGISLAGVDTVRDWKRTLEWVDIAEELGLHSVWLPEAHFVRGGVATPLVALAALAARTRKLRLATTSLLLPIHDPVAMARDVATLDQLSNGRVILGLGRGFRKALFDAFGVDASLKRDLFDESLDQMLKLWQGQSGTETGAILPPRQRPHPPLAVAAFGRKGLAQAARRGLPYLASPIESFDVIAENIAFHRENLPVAARQNEPVVPIMRTVFVSRDDQVLARVSARLAYEASATPRKLPPALARALAAPIESRVIVGTPSEVQDRLGRYYTELGASLIVVRPVLGGAGAAQQEDSLRCIHEEVLPAIRTSQ